MSSPTQQLCTFTHTLTLPSIPTSILSRTKSILLDGLGSGLLSSPLPWSQRALTALLSLDPSPGPCTLLGHPNPISAPTAALLNSSFIQGFELDDYHSLAPVHGASLVLPALLATAELLRYTEGRAVSGEELLVAAVVGLEVGPRVGMGCGGADILARGWHSGAVFGGPAVALAVGRLLGLGERELEWAVGHAATQAGGLMSAQFGSMGKRMQHGYAARNGLTAAFLARAGYTGIERVLEREYGGFFAAFNPESMTEGSKAVESVCEGLGERWEIENVIVKPAYGTMAATHAPIDCVARLQEENGWLKGREAVEKIEAVKVELGHAAFKHGGFKSEHWPLEPTEAQMSTAFAVATQLFDGEVLPTSFGPATIKRDEIRELMNRIECINQTAWDDTATFRTIVTVGLKRGGVLEAEAENPKGIKPKLSNGEIVEKFRHITKGLIEDERASKIEDLVTALDILDSIDELMRALKGEVKSII